MARTILFIRLYNILKIKNKKEIIYSSNNNIKVIYNSKYTITYDLYDLYFTIYDIKFKNKITISIKN